MGRGVGDGVGWRWWAPGILCLWFHRRSRRGHQQWLTSDPSSRRATPRIRPGGGAGGCGRRGYGLGGSGGVVGGGRWPLQGCRAAWWAAGPPGVGWGWVGFREMGVGGGVAGRRVLASICSLSPRRSHARARRARRMVCHAARRLGAAAVRAPLGPGLGLPLFWGASQPSCDRSWSGGPPSHSCCFSTQTTVRAG